MTTNISLNLTNQAAAGDQFWIALEQEKPDDLATVAEAAEVIDELFSLDPCSPVEEEEIDAPEQSLEEVLEDARAVFDDVLLNNQATLCTDENGCFPATVRVYRSHQDRPYTLLVQGGEKVSTIVGNVEAVAKTVTIKDASSVSMDLPADQPVSVSWQGPCYSKDAGRLEQSPELVVSAGKISWGIAVSAVLSVRYSMPYDLVTIQTTEEDCSVTGLYHLSVDEIDLESPPEDEEAGSLCQDIKSSIETPEQPMPACEELIKVEERCRCTNEVNDSYYKKEQTTCLPGDANGSEVNRGKTEVSYVGCGTKDEVSEPEYYIEKCCTSPLWVLPDCKKTYAVFSGGAGVDLEEKKSLVATYGNRIRFIPVGPQSGPCGQAVTEQVVDALNCCDGAPQLVADHELTPDTMTPSSQVAVFVKGGLGTFPDDSGCVRRVLPPREWKVSGADMWLNSLRTTKKATNNHNCIAIYAGPDACGPVHVYVTDGCSSTSITLRVTVGGWTLIAEEVLDGQSEATVECPVSGEGTEISPGVFEYVGEKYKIIEQVACGYLGGAWPDGTLPGYDKCAVFSYYLNKNVPHRNLPGCIAPTSGGDIGCSCEGLNPDRCTTCAEGGIMWQQSLNYSWTYAYATRLVYRAVYEWGCE